MLFHTVSITSEQKLKPCDSAFLWVLLDLKKSGVRKMCFHFSLATAGSIWKCSTNMPQHRELGTRAVKGEPGSAAFNSGKINFFYLGQIKSCLFSQVARCLIFESIFLMKTPWSWIWIMDIFLKIFDLPLSGTNKGQYLMLQQMMLGFLDENKVRRLEEWIKFDLWRLMITSRSHNT